MSENSLKIIESHDMEKLAADFLDFIDKNPLPGAFEKELIITGNRIMEGWLKQYFLFEFAGRQKVLANWEMQQINVFINDCLAAVSDIDSAEDKREPRFHPFSSEVMTWRIYAILLAMLEEKKHDCLTDYCFIDNGQLDAERTFSLAHKLANIFDNYQVYRPVLLSNKEKARAFFAGFEWQKEIWQTLQFENKASYLTQFLAVEKNISSAKLPEKFKRISIFAVSVIPPVYMHFLQFLSTVTEVRLYLFNPSYSDWLAQGNSGKNVSPEGKAPVGNKPANSNPVLKSLADGTKELLEEVHLRTLPENIKTLDNSSEKDKPQNLLDIIKDDLISNRCPDEKVPYSELIEEKNSSSLSIQACHSPLRELEILKDYIYKWFAEDSKLQPKDIQVQVTDMKTYLPYIHAVFGTVKKNAEDTIPYAVADRTVIGTNSIAKAFLQLLDIHKSRFKVNEILSLLECEFLREKFEISSRDLDTIKGWLADTAVFWGKDSSHRSEIIGKEGAGNDFGTWRRCLDRMLYGFSAGRSLYDPEKVEHAELSGSFLPYCEIEGDNALLLGRFSNFMEKLFRLGSVLNSLYTLSEWSAELSEILAQFFISNNNSCRLTAEVMTEIDAFRRFAEVTEIEKPVPCSIIALHLKQTLETALSGGNLTANNVIFSALRPMSSTPRKYSCILGLNDGDFPRADINTGFDLLRKGKRRCDRSLRKEDRQAFLEAVFSAQNHLYLSYLGRSEAADEKLPFSVVLCELHDYLEARISDSEISRIETAQRLQPFHPSYYKSGSGRFSYSRENYDIAEKLLNPQPEQQIFSGGFEMPEEIPELLEIEINDLINFFRNPARYYYKNHLQVRFEDIEDRELADSELQERNHLQKYFAKNQLLEGLLEQKNEADMQTALLDKGLIPYGDTGIRHYNNMKKKLTAFLECRIELENKSAAVADILKNHKKHTQCMYTSTQHNFSISMSKDLYLLEEEKNLTVISTKTGTVKAKDLLREWLIFLLLSAAYPDRNISSKLFGLHKGKPEAEAFFPLNAAEARDYLHIYALMYFKGSSALLPFAPATSYSWQLCMLKDLDKKLAPVEAEKKRAADAVNSARKTWFDKYFNNGDYTDIYYRQAFGEAGPMSDMDNFKTMAGYIFGALLKQTEKNR